MVKTLHGKRDPREVRLSDLVIDDDLYRRVRLSSSVVKQYTEAIRSGAKMPPILVERTTMRVTDGVHRYSAHAAVFGVNAMVPVVWWGPAKNRAEWLLRATAANATHGLRYSPADLAKGVLDMRACSIGFIQIAAALAMSVDRVKAIYRAARDGHSGRAEQRESHGGKLDYAPDLIKYAKAILNIFDRGWPVNKRDAAMCRYLWRVVETVTQEVPKAVE